MGVVFSGSVRTIRTSIRGPRGSADGLLSQLVVGDHVSPGQGGITGTVTSPYQLLPDSHLACIETFDYYNMGAAGLVISTVEGTHMAKSIQDNSGTILHTGTQAGYEGALTFVSGAADNDDISIQLNRAFLPAANKYAVCITRLYLPSSPAATVGEIGFGFANTCDMFASAPTHGAYIVRDDGAATAVGRSKDGSTSSDTSTLFTSAISTGYDLAVVINGVASVDFYYKVSTATAWNKTNKTTNLPTQAQRLTLAFRNGSAAARTVMVDRLIYCGMKAASF